MKPRYEIIEIKGQPRLWSVLKERTHLRRVYPLLDWRAHAQCVAHGLTLRESFNFIPREAQVTVVSLGSPQHGELRARRNGAIPQPLVKESIA